MRTKFAHILVVFSLIVTIGGHWAFLQSVAWVGMAISYSHDAPLVEALVKTFDGKHPCQLCIAVKTGQEAAKKQASLKAETKFDLLLARVSSFRETPVPFVVLPSEPDSARTRVESPPTPPPRLA